MLNCADGLDETTDLPRLEAVMSITRTFHAFAVPGFFGNMFTVLVWSPVPGVIYLVAETHCIEPVISNICTWMHVASV